MVHLARVQGGQQIQTGDIWLIFRRFEFAAQRRNRVRGAVSGWAPVIFFIAIDASRRLKTQLLHHNTKPALWDALSRFSAKIATKNFSCFFSVLHQSSQIRMGHIDPFKWDSVCDMGVRHMISL
jgi:hypothetical protein